MRRLSVPVSCMLVYIPMSLLGAEIKPDREDKQEGEIRFPSDVLDLTAWKLTLPIPDPANPKKVSSPWEIGSPNLAIFSLEPWFSVVEDEDGTAIRFRAGHGGVTTSGSKNPRSELREMKPGYPKKHSQYHASWATDDGQIRSLVIKQKVTHLTSVKPHVVTGQIHDSEDDVTVFRVEGHGGGSPDAEISTASIWITDGDKSHGYLVDDDYKLGTVFTVRFIVSGGVISYEYNGKRLPYSQKKSAKGCYFKLGNYTQSNDKTAPTEKAGAYAETLVYEYKLEHGFAK
ncbi:MAG: polysaccharide lyase family 7 protein [Akkermansiaceae bacterium]|nr:polysaccharide lyase family 7 protein [Akkermansiaceae bacterium]MDP4648010.1 polysaccharide lyase family 7 protein [Akkermansiaceae bacterium]MDP4720337.1 polysaccharide lyase family 7 protein [Akkermansiaceae bacterium]MDP4781358.1 polysaccharide lyase family 7 protein [Akkermansiaceae bacterium]MDP4897606.1 polysaccharide lyase family 7 protein [Akkermansiaceae bacterium]